MRRFEQTFIVSLITSHEDTLVTLRHATDCFLHGCVRIELAEESHQKNPFPPVYAYNDRMIFTGWPIFRWFEVCSDALQSSRRSRKSPPFCSFATRVHWRIAWHSRYNEGYRLSEITLRRRCIVTGFETTWFNPRCCNYWRFPSPKSK